MKKAILLIGPSISGAEKRYYHLFKYMQNNDDIDYILIINRALYKSLILYDTKASESKNIIVLKSNMYSDNKFIRLLGQIKASIEIFSIVKRKSIRLVHSVMGGLFLIDVMKICSKNIHVTYSESYSSRLDNFDLSNRFYKKYRKNILKCSWVTTHTEEVKKYINELGVQSNRISVSPCSFIKQINYHDEKKNNVVIFAGRLSDEKNPILFLESAAKVMMKRPDLDIEFKIFGSGKLQKDIENFIKVNNLVNITLGYTPSIMNEMIKSKVFCSLQKFTNYPSQSLLESMYCKNAVIATNFGDTYKLVSEKNGYLVNENSDEIAMRLIELFDNEETLNCKMENSKNVVITEHTVDIYYKYLKRHHDELLKLL